MSVLGCLAGRRGNGQGGVVGDMGVAVAAQMSLHYLKVQQIYKMC